MLTSVRNLAGKNIRLTAPALSCSFLIRRGSNLYSRRESKITTLLLSLFTSAYTYYWSDYFPPNEEEPEGKKLLYPPSFDARVVCYPSEKEIRDYFSWRQVDSELLSGLRPIG